MGAPLALAPFLPSAGIVATALAVAAVFAMPSLRARAIAAIVALVLAPVLLLGELWDNPQIAHLRDQPAKLAAAVLLGVIVAGALAALFVRRPAVFPLLAFAALPFRVPVETGGESANLLVPLYVVVAAGVAAYAWVRVRGGRPRGAGARGGRANRWSRAASSWRSSRSSRCMRCRPATPATSSRRSRTSPSSTC